MRHANTELGHYSAENTANDLGIVICKFCSQIIATLPTNGYKKFYIVCDHEQCVSSNETQGGNENEC
ncbi:hypothetical protein KCTCHS21_22600 [Cohnella abietis]|uniref:GapA-binding peptide SR1P n=1 Tax=Cohnella abietis TaxID=2507935 RepID=A0A3T1D476_9BACL|nr:hypothetical protein KCTCHS21_22600 [Cohnella abietis]